MQKKCTILQLTKHHPTGHVHKMLPFTEINDSTKYDTQKHYSHKPGLKTQATES